MEVNEAELEKEIEDDLRTNPKYKEFYEMYNPASIEEFINSYKKRKVSWLKYGEWYVEDEQKRALRYKEIASKILWEIQQVKLFDAQCLWRAEQLIIPEITVCQEFTYWEKNIENCLFLSPISEEELNLYKEYLLTDDADIQTGYFHFGFDDWQDYDEIKRSYVNEEDGYVTAPEWYLYYFNRRGGAPCAYLPDTRGEKEEFYLALERKHRLQNQPPPAPAKSVDNRPRFSYYVDENLFEFVTRFENRKIKEYAMVMKNRHNVDDDDELDEAITSLKTADERLEIVSENLSWRDAIIKTALLYAKKKIYQALDGAHKSYLQRLKLGIAFETDEKPDHIEFYKNLCEIQKKDILIGRKLNNEPEDFNF